jgi:hypothetical protein
MEIVHLVLLLALTPLFLVGLVQCTSRVYKYVLCNPCLGFEDPSQAGRWAGGIFVALVFVITCAGFANLAGFWGGVMFLVDAFIIIVGICYTCSHWTEIQAWLKSRFGCVCECERGCNRRPGCGGNCGGGCGGGCGGNCGGCGCPDPTGCHHRCHGHCHGHTRI